MTTSIRMSFYLAVCLAIVTSACVPFVTPAPSVTVEAAASTARPASERTVRWSEFGHTISLSYDVAVISRVDAETVPAVPFNGQTFFAGTHPTYVRFSFPEFQPGRSYELPVSASENVAQLMFFQTADFQGFGDDSFQGYTHQLDDLNHLLETGIEPTHCASLLTYEFWLPFLPWINEAQVFCAQPQIIQFLHGRGIRYLSYYSQGLDPVLDQKVFYTFQGVTDDEKFYVSALFPIRTGIFPTESPACTKCDQPNYDPAAEWKALVTEQLDQLNAQPQDKFKPSLNILDELIQCIQIGE